MNAVNTPPFKPFTRVITTPNGLPWDQTRMARLEAAHTSPVAVDDLTIVIRRLEAWAYNSQGRFVAIYLRGSDVRAGLSFKLEIAGKTLSIDMPTRAHLAQMAQLRTLTIGLSLVTIIGLLSMAAISFKRHSDEQTKLDEVEISLNRQLHIAKGLAKSKADALGLADQHLENNRFSSALADLTTLTQSRDPDARFDAFYWNKGYWAVEAHSEHSPLKTDTMHLQRSAKPVRRGTYLWIASPQKAGQE